jgi:hypothetical protein
VSVALTLMVSSPSRGQESASGMVYANGSASVNGTQVPKSVAVFPGDTVQTDSGASANIGSSGSSVMLLSDSKVKYEGTSVGVDHGSVRIDTASAFEAHACAVWARPVNQTATQYEFTHNDGHVLVLALKGDVIVEGRRRTSDREGDQKRNRDRVNAGQNLVKEGEQATRDDGCEVAEKKNPKRRPGASAAAGGGILSSSIALYTGIGIVGGVTIWVLLQGDDPLSPACPTKTCQ